MQNIHNLIKYIVDRRNHIITFWLYLESGERMKNDSKYSVVKEFLSFTLNKYKYISF